MGAADVVCYHRLMKGLPLTPGRVEVLDDEMVRIYRAMTGAERLRIASDMFASARRMLTCHLAHEHPDWSEAEILRETARRLSHGAI